MKKILVLTVYLLSLVLISACADIRKGKKQEPLNNENQELEESASAGEPAPSGNKEQNPQVKSTNKALTNNPIQLAKFKNSVKNSQAEKEENGYILVNDSEDFNTELVLKGMLYTLPPQNCVQLEREDFAHLSIHVIDGGFAGFDAVLCNNEDNYCRPGNYKIIVKDGWLRDQAKMNPIWEAINTKACLRPQQLSS